MQMKFSLFYKKVLHRVLYGESEVSSLHSKLLPLQAKRSLYRTLRKTSGATYLSRYEAGTSASDVSRLFFVSNSFLLPPPTLYESGQHLRTRTDLNIFAFVIAHRNRHRWVSSEKKKLIFLLPPSPCPRLSDTRTFAVQFVCFFLCCCSSSFSPPPTTGYPTPAR